MVGGGQRHNLTEVLRWKVAEVTWRQELRRIVWPFGYLVVYVYEKSHGPLVPHRILVGAGD